MSNHMPKGIALALIGKKLPPNSRTGGKVPIFFAWLEKLSALKLGFAISRLLQILENFCRFSTILEKYKKSIFYS